MMKQKIPLFVPLFLFLAPIWAQDCNCDVTLTGLKQDSANVIHSSDVDYIPGDTICIPAGTYGGLRFFRFQGTEANPTVFINCGGKVEIVEQESGGIEFYLSNYIRITGTGDAEFEHGIHVKELGNQHAMGLAVASYSSDFEIDHLEIENTGFAGIMAKTDPYCEDPASWRSNGYVLKNLNIHHNYIHDTGGEGIYVGFTGGYKVESTRTCNGNYIFGHWLENVDIHHNLIENTGWDGIQLTLVRENGKIRDNKIYNSATANVLYQDFGISIAGGIFEVYNNYIGNNGLGNSRGMQFISAESGTKIFNNVIVRPKSRGLFLHNRHEFDDKEEGYYVVNNTIIEPTEVGVFYNTAITLSHDPTKVGTTQEYVPSYFVNNLIVDPGDDYTTDSTWRGDRESYFGFNRKIERDALLDYVYANVLTRQMDTLGLKDIANNDFSAEDPNSALVDVGTDLRDFGIGFDHDNNPRPSGNNNFDIGAHELQYTIKPPKDPNKRIKLFPNPATSFFKMVDKKRKRKNKKQRRAQIVITPLNGGAPVYDGPYKLGKRFYFDSYEPGIYAVKIYYPKKTFTKQLVIQ